MLGVNILRHLLIPKWEEHALLFQVKWLNVQDDTLKPLALPVCLFRESQVRVSQRAESGLMFIAALPILSKLHCWAKIAEFQVKQCLVLAAVYCWKVDYLLRRVTTQFWNVDGLLHACRTVATLIKWVLSEGRMELARYLTREGNGLFWYKATIEWVSSTLFI